MLVLGRFPKKDYFLNSEDSHSLGGICGLTGLLFRCLGCKRAQEGERGFCTEGEKEDERGRKKKFIKSTPKTHFPELVESKAFIEDLLQKLHKQHAQNVPSRIGGEQGFH